MGPYEAMEALRERLDQRKLEHRELDDLISTKAGSAAVDQILLRRLKKRKLALKDEIEHLMNALRPDIIA